MLCGSLSNSLVGNGASAVVLLALAVAALVSHRSITAHATALGVLLPIDTVSDVSVHLLDVARYTGIIWLVLRLKPSLSPMNTRRTMCMAGWLTALGAWLLVVALWRDDQVSRTVAMAVLVSAPAAFLLVRRASIHLAVVQGFLCGVSASALVVIAQYVGIHWLRSGGPDGDRNPGLAGSTALVTWQMALGIVIAVFVMLNADRKRCSRLLAAVGAALCGLGLLLCGAQGGLLGLGAAALATIARPPPPLRGALTRSPRVTAATALAVLLAVGMAVWANVPTVAGVLGDGGYVNEIARLDLNRAAWREFMSNPLTGIGADRFQEIHGLMPHLLPLDAAVSAGVVGLVLASAALLYSTWFLVGSLPRRTTLTSWFGLAMGCLLLINSLADRSGSLIGISRLSLLMIAMAAARGEIGLAQSQAQTSSGIGGARSETTRVSVDADDLADPGVRGEGRGQFR